MKVLFLHGMHGTPDGTKPTYLKENGFEVCAPSLPKDDWEASRAAALTAFADFEPDVIIGSSRGGALACDLPAPGIPKVLVAPAYKHFPAKVVDVDKSTWILHCPEDDTVRFEHSKQLSESCGATLLECGEDHRMSDKITLSLIRSLLDLINKANG